MLFQISMLAIFPWILYHLCLFHSVSMENISTDIHELERGMDLTKRESLLRKDSRDYPLILKDFLSSAEDKFKKLLGDVKTAQVNL